MTRKKYAKFWSRRSIVSLIGIDYPILEQTNNDNFLKFYATGFLVILIMIISFLSVFYGFDLMFDMWDAELLLSTFFSLMFFNIYIFLIQTFSKEVFPMPFKLPFLNLSNLSRIGFVLFIGFLIAQPVKIYCVRHQLDTDIEVYKNQLYQSFCKKNTGLYHNDLNKLNREKSYYASIGTNEYLNNQLIKIDQQIAVIHTLINKANYNALSSISRSNFFIKRVALASKYPETTGITILVLAIFFAPVALIYSISENSQYYLLKKKKDKAMVIKEYKKFKTQYTHLFSSKYGIEGVQFHEPYVNPPFNTIKKAVPKYSDQQEFLNNLLER